MTTEEMIDILDKAEVSPFYDIMGALGKDDFTKATKLIKDYFKCDDNTAKICCMDFKTKVYDELNKPDPSLSAWEIQQANCVPTCPTCGSTNIQKISGLNRAAHGYMFGLFSKTAKSQFCCKNCGYKW